MKTIVEILIFALIGTVVGYVYKDLQTTIKRLEKKISEPEPEIGATAGSYNGGTIQKINQDGEVGVVEPKTPQQLEWEESERLRIMNLNVRVKPR